MKKLQQQKEEAEKRRKEFEEKRRIEVERQQEEKRQREEDFKRNMESNFSQQETQVRDAAGNRWIKCEFCGKIAMEMSLTLMAERDILIWEHVKSVLRIILMLNKKQKNKL